MSYFFKEIQYKYGVVTSKLEGGKIQLSLGKIFYKYREYNYRRPYEALNNLTPDEWKINLEITHIHKSTTVFYKGYLQKGSFTST